MNQRTPMKQSAHTNTGTLCRLALLLALAVGAVMGLALQASADPPRYRIIVIDPPPSVPTLTEFREPHMGINNRGEVVSTANAAPYHPFVWLPTATMASLRARMICRLRDGQPKSTTMASSLGVPARLPIFGTSIPMHMVLSRCTPANPTIQVSTTNPRKAPTTSTISTSWLGGGGTATRRSLRLDFALR